jgi:hypothetical protein
MIIGVLILVALIVVIANGERLEGPTEATYRGHSR